MASIQDLICDAAFFPRHVIKQQQAYQSIEKERHFAALQIEKTFRGYLVRKEIRRLHRAATVLQKYIRRWLVKLHMCDYIQAYMDYFRMRQYNRMATKIQALWRGYWYRKHNMNAHDMITQRRRVAEANERMRKLMQVAFDNMDDFKKEMMDEEAQKWVIFIIFKLHHHLRSKHMEGIYSFHNKQQLSFIEKLIKSMPMTEYMKELKSKYYQEIKKGPKPVRYVFKSKKGRELEDIYRKFEKDHGLRDTVQVDCNNRKKPFVLPKKLPKKKYEREMLLTEKYTGTKSNLERRPNISKQVISKGFDLNGLKKIISHLKPSAYHIDFWNHACEVHNIPKN